MYMIKKPRLLLALFVIPLFSIWFIFDLGQYITLDYFKTQQINIETWKNTNPLSAAAIFFTIFI